MYSFLMTLDREGGKGKNCKGVIKEKEPLPYHSSSKGRRGRVQRKGGEINRDFLCPQKGKAKLGKERSKKKRIKAVGGREEREGGALVTLGV